MWLHDPKTGKKSVTLTFLTLGFLLASFKLLMSGITPIAGVTFSEFSGIDFGAVLGAVGSIYAWRKMQNNDPAESQPPIEGSE